MRRVRASFLLRRVLLAAMVGALIGFFWLGNSMGWSLAFVAFLVAFWVIAVELDMLPMTIEYGPTHWVSRSAAPIHSIWFVDLDRKAQRERRYFEQGTRKNPTLR